MISNPSRALAIAAGVVIVALTAAAFWLSYAHLAEVALDHGMEGKEVRAWAWPATLDLFIVAGELLMLRAALAGKVDPWAIGLTVVGSGSSIALNVAGVGTAAGTLDYVVAAVPPTAALLAFGALMRQIHQALAGRDEEGSSSVSTPAVEVTVERVDTEQPKALPEPVEVVPAGIRMLPIVARPEPAPRPSPYQWDHIRGRLAHQEDDQDWPASDKEPPVIDPYDEWSPDLNDEEGDASVPTPNGDHGQAGLVTASVPAETPRQVVTEVVTLTPSELYRRACKLNREVVTSTNRPVTIDRLREEFDLSRRDATELRRRVVTPGGGERS